MKELIQQSYEMVVAKAGTAKAKVVKAKTSERLAPKARARK